MLYGAQWHNPLWSLEPGAPGYLLYGLHVSYCCGLITIAVGVQVGGFGLQVAKVLVLQLQHQSFQWIRSDQSLSRVRLFATPWIAARQASLSGTNSRSSPRLTSIESVIPSSHFILCCPLLLLPPIPPIIRVFSNESTLRTRWPKYWSFIFSIIPSKEIPGLISFRTDWLDLLQFKGLSRVFSNTTVQKHQFFGAQPSSQSNSHIHTWPLEKS